MVVGWRLIMTIAININSANPTLAAAPNNGGQKSTTSLIPMKEPLHRQAKIRNNIVLILGWFSINSSALTDWIDKFLH